MGMAMPILECQPTAIMAPVTRVALTIRARLILVEDILVVHTDVSDLLALAVWFIGGFVS
jgi:hypothetical protein